MAAAPTVAHALQLAPVQKGVTYDRPSEDAAGKCTIKAEPIDGHTGWVVRDAGGQVLRQFVDTNGNNVVDQWSYFYNGLEAYRDFDSDHNGKADQCRWLNFAGSRWGLDRDEDGRIDSWKSISAEEVTEEVVRSLVERDAERFARLILTPDEAASLGTTKAKTDELLEKIERARSAFATLAANQKLITPQTEWVHFGAVRPGAVPVGAGGATKELLVYENAVAVVENGGQHEQLQIGTMVRVGDVWRIIDVPRTDASDDTEVAATGFFFLTSARPEVADSPTDGPTRETQALLDELEKLDQTAGEAADAAAFNAQRADLLERLATTATDESDRAQWVRQFADTVGVAVQSGNYPDGVARLKSLYESLAAQEASKDLAAYVKFRYMSAEYGATLQAPNADFAKIQTQWLADLEAYVNEYPRSPDAAEAMLQLGIAQEFAGQEDAAKEWYRKIVDGFSESQAAKKASGSLVRLDSVGKTIQLKGSGAAGGTVDLAKYAGRVVLIHYWATWCEPCKADLAQLKELYAKYGSSGFDLIGVSLDSRQEDLLDYLKQNRLPWKQIFEPGGLDSRLANELGVLTLPTMLLVDAKGKVVNRNIHVTELESDLATRLAKPTEKPAASPAQKPNPTPRRR